MLVYFSRQNLNANIFYVFNSNNMTTLHRLPDTIHRIQCMNVRFMFGLEPVEFEIVSSLSSKAP